MFASVMRLRTVADLLDDHGGRGGDPGLRDGGRTRADVKYQGRHSADLISPRVRSCGSLET